MQAYAEGSCLPGQSVAYTSETIRQWLLELVCFCHVIVSTHDVGIDDMTC